MVGGRHTPPTTYVIVELLDFTYCDDILITQDTECEQQIMTNLK